MARKDETEIDYRFFCPDNIVDIRRNNAWDDEYDYTTVVDPLNPDQYPQTTPNYEKLPTPRADVNIVSQIVKTTPDGSITIDVVLEVPEQPQNVEYETQITKVA